MKKLINRNTTLYAFLICLMAALLVAAPTASIGQNKDDLEKQKSQIQKDIAYKNKLLQETKKNKQLSIGQLVLLNKQISSREQLIRTINREVRILDKQIEETNALIASMENDLKNLKEEYAKMIYYAYKNKSSYDKLMFIFSAKDFNQAYKRLKYYQQYSEYRKKQAEMIRQTQESLNQKVAALKVKKIEKESLLNQERAERNQLAEEKQEKQQLVNGLQGDEKKLKDEINKKKKEAAKLQKMIQKIIEEEIAKSKEKGKFVMTPEAKALSESFANNKAKLPWPVEKGVITGKYGVQAHPVLKGIQIQNNGIDISTTEGAAARAVFDGEVTKVMIIPGVGKVVMIRHGEYYSVYSNLKETFVQSGDKVTTKQMVGSVITDDQSGKTEVHFEIWKRQTTLNPSQWIYKGY